MAIDPKRPLGLLTIRTPEGALKTFTVFTYFQNGVDYLQTIGEAWQKIGVDEYRTGTGYTVRLEMVVPKFIDLRKEEYLWVNEDQKDIDKKAKENEQENYSR